MLSFVEEGNLKFSDSKMWFDFPGKNSKPTRTLPNNTSHVSFSRNKRETRFFLPCICHQMTIAWSSLLLKSFNFLSFSGHPPKTGSVANFLSVDFYVRKSVYDILWIIIPKKKKEKELAILDNAITLLMTLQFIDIYFCMTTLLRRTHKTRQVF